MRKTFDRLKKNKKPATETAPTDYEDQEELLKHVIVNDAWGMRFTHYETDSETLEVVVGKEFYKPELLAMRRLIKPGATIVDIGANIGLFSVFLSKEIGPKGTLYAFEPVKETYWRMRENLALNRCENVFAYQQAVSNKNGTAVMNIFPEGYGAWNTFGKPKFGKIVPVSTEKVPTVRLDDFAAKNGIKRVDFLKIDVEGFEKDVMQGAVNLLSTGKVKYLSFEISDIPLKGANRKGSDIFDLMEQHGYTVFEFDEKSKKFKGPITGSDTFYQNFYASKSDLRKL